MDTVLCILQTSVCELQAFLGNDLLNIDIQSRFSDWRNQKGRGQEDKGKWATTDVVLTLKEAKHLEVLRDHNVPTAEVSQTELA